MDFLSKNTQETKKLAGELAKKLKPGMVLALYGDLGSGKTTFTSYLVHALGIDSRVQSPTFVIMRRYKGGKGSVKGVNHLDLYRLEDLEEIRDLGLSEVFTDSGMITIIEWPEFAEPILPEDVIKIDFHYAGENQRKINVQNIF